MQTCRGAILKYTPVPSIVRVSEYKSTRLLLWYPSEGVPTSFQSTALLMGNNLTTSDKEAYDYVYDCNRLTLYQLCGPTRVTAYFPATECRTEPGRSL